VEDLLLNMVELNLELEGIELVSYLHAGNPLAKPEPLARILGRFQRFRCRVYRLRHLFGWFLPVLAWAGRLDCLHLPVHLWEEQYDWLHIDRRSVALVEVAAAGGGFSGR
jgi:hypothetical protein